MRAPHGWRLARLAILAILCLATALPAFAQGDQISTSGGGGNIVADARAWWRRHTDEFRTRTSHCLELLDEAESHRVVAMRYKERAKAKGPMSSAERTRLNRLGNEEYAIVTRLVRQFHECARAPSDQFRTGGTDREQRPQPRQPSPGRGDRVDTGDDDRRQQPQPRQPTPRRGDRVDTGDDDRRQEPARRDAGRSRPRPTLEGGIERICDLQTLAVWLFRNYATHHPIARVRVVNATQPTYLLLLSGLSYDRSTANTLGQGYIAWLNIQAFDIYRLAVMDAVQDLPRGTDLIIVGHSQGGMEAQDVVESLRHRWGYNVRQVVSYGAPVTTSEVPGTAYLHVRAPDDPILHIQRRPLTTRRQTISANAGTADPHGSYPTRESGLDLFRVPAPSTLRTPCYEIDVRTLEQFEAPTLMERLRPVQRPIDPRVSQTRLNPHNGDVNCFWVSLAKDFEWATGIEVPATCDAEPATNATVESVLWRRYGARPLDDRHGPTPGHGIARHGEGYPVPMSNRRKIEAALAEPGSRGLVFVFDKARPNDTGHVFNARNNGGRIEYWDEQRGNDAQFWFGDPQSGFKFYRTN